MARRDAALVCIPDGRLIIIGGYNASEAHSAIESVECLSLDAPQDGWQNIAPLPQPICLFGAVYFHDFVIIAGGKGERWKYLPTVYALKLPCLPILNVIGEGELEELGQWTKLSAELPCPTMVASVCRVGEELFTFRKIDLYLLCFFKTVSLFHVGFGHQGVFKFTRNEGQEIPKGQVS